MLADDLLKLFQEMLIPHRVRIQFGLWMQETPQCVEDRMPDHGLPHDYLGRAKILLRLPGVRAVV
jgi:hypothetical protein